MPDESTTTTEAASQATSDGTDKNTGEQASGAGTQPAQQTTEAQPTEKTFTQADVDRIVANRIKSGVKAELKRLTGETDGTPTVEELSKQLSEERQARQTLEARQTVRDYLTDPKHKLNVKADAVAAIEKLVLPDLVFEDDGKPSNLKEAVDAAKSLAPALFVNAPQSIDAAQGRNGAAVTGSDMNSFIRRSAGFGN
jgi:hypothetical protein